MQKLGYLTGAIADKHDGQLIDQALRGIYNKFSTQLLNSAAVGNTTTKLKTTALIHYLVNGTICSKAITDNFWTIAGTVTDGTTAPLCLYIDAAGAASYAWGTAATTGTAGQLASGNRIPATPENKVLVAIVVISASGGDFTGGTSNPATAGNFTVTIINTVGMFDPTATI